MKPCSQPFSSHDNARKGCSKREMVGLRVEAAIAFVTLVHLRFCHIRLHHMWNVQKNTKDNFDWRDQNIWNIYNIYEI